MGLNDLSMIEIGKKKERTAVLEIDTPNGSAGKVRLLTGKPGRNRTAKSIAMNN